MASLGVRFSGPSLSKHMSLSSIGSTPRSSRDQYASYNRQQIYKKINDWFGEWRPWQQRMLLCGLTNRCSTSQLESIATTLEPLFHRDFVTTLRKRYPSAPFKRRDTRKERKELEAFARKLASEIIDKAISQCINIENNALENLSLETDELGNVQGVTIDVSQLESEQTRAETEVAPTDDQPQEPKSDPTLFKEEENEDNKKERELSENAAGDPEAEVAVANPDDEGGDGETKQEAEDSEAMGDGQELANGEKLDNITEAEEEEIDDELDESELLFIKPPPKYDGPRKIHISRPFLTSFEYAPKLHPEEGTGIVSYKDNLGLLLTRQHTSITNQQHTRQSYPPVAPCSGIGSRVHRHRSGIATAEVRMSDFFDKGRITKLGPMQAQLRSGSVRRPPHVTDLNAPVQKMYKHVKFWSPNPKEGKSFVRPKKAHLKWHFREQVNSVWEWMSEWEDYEKLNLLVEIVKLCDHELLNYLTQCLIERLHERIDITWLSDPLLVLIFSYLPVQDIDSCSRVCRRWRYLSSTNELWMIKSQEYGLDQGIPNILELVRGAGKREQSVDWRLAYLELQAITEQARKAIPLPSRLAFESSTPLGMKRVGGKFLPASEPGSIRGQSRASRVSASSVLSAVRNVNTATSMRRTLLLKQPEENSQSPVLEQDDGLQSVHEHAVSTHPPESSFPSRGVSRYQSAISPVKSERLLRSRDEPRASKISIRRGKPRPPKPSQPPTAKGALRQVRGRRKGGDEEEDVALDVRPELVQSKDLLSKGATIPPKQWTAEEAKEARERLENYTGKAEPIRRVRKLQGHMDAVLSVEFDSRRLISGSMDRSIRIWDIRSGRSLHKLFGHKGGITCLCFDNETLYSGSWDTAVMAWSLLTFERIQVLTGHKGSVSCLAMNDDFVFSGSHDHTVRVWRRSTLLIHHVIEGHSCHVTCMALQGPHVITGSSDRSIRITDFLTGVCARVIRTTYPVDTLWLTGGLLLTGNAEGQLFIINKETGDPEVAIRAHDAAVTRVNFHSGHIFTASADSTIKEWDMMTMTCIRSLQGHKGAVKDFKTSSKCMVSAGADGHIRVWDKILPMYALSDNDDQIRMEVVDQTKGP